MTEDKLCVCGGKPIEDGFCKDCLKKIEADKIKSIAERKARDDLKEKLMRRCEMPGCNKKHLAKGLCESHYKHEWHQTPRHKEYHKAFNKWHQKTAKYLKWRREYRQRPEVLAKEKAYRQRPEVKERIKILNTKYRQKIKQK